jgi:hypothetical protein
MKRTRLQSMAVLLALGAALASCVSMYDDSAHQRRSPLPVSVATLAADQIDYSIARGLHRFGSDNDFYVDGNCLVFAVAEDLPPNARTCFHIEADELVQVRQTLSANLYLDSWYREIEAGMPERWIFTALDEDVRFTALHHQYLEHLRKIEPEVRVNEPFGLLTRDEISQLIATMPVSDIFPEKFSQYADTRYYRKRLLTNNRLPGDERVRVFFASQFFDLTVNNLYVMERPVIEALVRAVAYDYLPEVFMIEDERLSVSLSQGRWAFHNRSDGNLEITRIAGRYHELKKLLLDPDTTAPLVLEPGETRVLDASDHAHRTFGFPEDRFIGVLDWRQSIVFTLRLDYRLHGEEFVLQRSEMLVAQH